MSADYLNFSAQEFVEKMELGLFDGRLHEEIEKLSYDQLREVARIFTQRPIHSTPSETQL